MGIVTGEISVYAAPGIIRQVPPTVVLRAKDRVGILTANPRRDKAVQIFLRVDGGITHRIGNAYLWIHEDDLPLIMAP